MRKRRAKTRRLVRSAVLLALATIPVLLIIASLLAPWYEVTNSVYGGPVSVEYTLYDETTTADAFGTMWVQTVQFSDESFQARHGNVSVVMETARLLTLAALPCAVAHMMSTIYVIKRRGNELVPAIIGLTTMAMIFIVPIYFALSLPDAYVRDAVPIAELSISGIGPWSGFYGGGSGERLDAAWGPAIGWYMMFAAGFFAYAGAFHFMLDWNKARCRKPARNELASAPRLEGDTDILEIPRRKPDKEG